MAMDSGGMSILPNDSMEHVNPQFQQVQIPFANPKLIVRRLSYVATVGFLLLQIQLYESAVEVVTDGRLCVLTALR